LVPQTGEDVLKFYKWDVDMGFSALYLAVIMAVFLTLGYIFLRLGGQKFMPVVPKK
jgi:hypothetical protein